jgi:hypothetical protein
MRLFVTLSSVLSILILSIAFGGTTGKIDGVVTDAKTGEKLVSVNIIVQGTKLGATTNLDGYFVILNVPPGEHVVQASLLGYSAKRIADVRVNIDQTTTLKIALTEEMFQGEEVVVVADRPVVQRDVSSSAANITPMEIQTLPAAAIITNVVGLQAGVQTNQTGDLVIRGSGGTSVAGGGGSDQTLLLVNGHALRDSRDNSPFTGISLVSIDNIQVTSGGFNAEYGNVRSGLVNVVTKEGNSSKYNFGVIARYAPQRPKHFGMSAYDRNSFFIRPYLDDAVAWTGTGRGFDPGAWDYWTRQQYPEFEGWNSISQKTLQDNDPDNDLTPEAAQRLFLWQHRRQAEVSLPDYDIDAGLGGPLIPGLSEQLGDLRFFASYRRSQLAYLIPLSDSAYRDENFQIKITSNIADGMKLSLEGLYSTARGTNNNNVGEAGVYRSPASIADNLDRVSFIDTRIFAPDYWAPTTIRSKMVGAKFVHNLSNSAFYDATFTIFQSRYNTAPGRERDNARIYRFGNNYYVDEAPFGFQALPLPGNYSSGAGIGNNMRMGGGGMSNSRDQSIVTNYNARVDFSAQLDNINLLKSGIEFTYTDLDVSYGSVDAFLPVGRSTTTLRKFPKQGAAYVQDKLEFEGMIANLGVRLDYSYAGGEWYRYSPFSRAFSNIRLASFDTLAREQVTSNVTLSPRLGVAFPITTDSKLFFNYGHFRAVPLPEDFFILRAENTSGSLLRIGNPNNPLPRTISYELGYEQNLFDQLLFRLTGYYKDISGEVLLVEYVDSQNGIDYFESEPLRYRDIRGFEATINKNRGDWIQGFINFTYDVRSRGYFGYLKYDINPGTQREYERRIFKQTKPLPQPFARANINLFTPPDVGPGSAGLSLLGDWSVTLAPSWSAGSYFSYPTPGGEALPGRENNMQERDFFNMNMKIAKRFKISGIDLQLFADITNVFNNRNLTSFGFFNVTDYDQYIQSLHLPSDVAGDPISRPLGYSNIPGDDRFGDYRKEGVEFQPIEIVRTFSELGGADPRYNSARPFYYVADQEKYYQLVSGTWREVDPARLRQVLDDKAYIDMPNMETFTFLNPRNIFFGIRLSVDF